ncbi:MAG: ribosomal protein S18-alanine N-acetyltransferase [Myxococcota bacterium]
MTAGGRAHAGGERPATAADLPAIAQLDAACFGRAWSTEVYEQEFERPFAQLYVVERAGTIIGLSCTWIVGDEAHLLRIATLARHRRGGLGRMMLSSVVDRATAAGCERIILEVGASNVPAVSLYERFAFERIGLRRGYYREPPDDALVMQRMLPGAGSSSG